MKGKRRKLFGAALAAHNLKRAKRRTTKKGKRKMAKRKLHGAALTAHNRKVGKRRSSSGGGGRARRAARGIGRAAATPAGIKLGITVAAAAYGYVDNNANMLSSTLEKLKGHGVPHDLIVGGLAHFAATKTSGSVRKACDFLSVATLSIGGYKVGAAKGSFSSVAGDDGDIGDDDIGDDDYDDVGDDDIGDDDIGDDY